MTKNEIKAALNLAGIEHKAKPNLETLQALFDQAVAEQILNEDGTLYQKGPEGDDAVPPANLVPADADPMEPEAPAPEATGTGLKIEKDRPEQNGIKRPSIGGKCRAIWDALDAFRAETGELPTSKTVKELAADEGWNPNNASIEYYQWRKYNGISKQS